MAFMLLTQWKANRRDLIPLLTTYGAIWLPSVVEIS